FTRKGWPLRTFNSWMRPSVPMTPSSCTTPSILALRAIGGYNASNRGGGGARLCVGAPRGGGGGGGGARGGKGGGGGSRGGGGRAGGGDTRHDQGGGAGGSAGGDSARHSRTRDIRRVLDLRRFRRNGSRRVEGVRCPLPRDMDRPPRLHGGHRRGRRRRRPGG